MSAIRRVSSRILLFVVRQSAAENRSWGNAMLRELDFVDNDWAALLWALGSTTAICRHSLIHRLKQRRGTPGPEPSSLRQFARSMTSVLSGMAVAGVVLTVSVALLSVTRTS